MPNIVYAGGGKLNPEDKIWGDAELIGLIDRSSALTQIPPSLKTIGSGAFNGCTNLALTSLPEGATNIAGSAFSGCRNLKTLSIGSAIQKIDSLAFYNCVNLASITINRAPNSVSGAPWGATNATVTWTGTT